MPSPLLQVEKLTITSGHGDIVRDLSFSIMPGEIVALTGRSGSGKTSIALAILGLLPEGLHHHEGSIIWTGKDQVPVRLPENKLSWPSLRGLHIGYTQQDVFGAFDPVLRMGDQMIMVITERSGRPKHEIEKDLRIKLEEVGLHDIDRLWNSYPHQLSGGQLQRCQICMSIIIQPEMIISDEPTSAIDKINQIELLDVFSMLRSRYNMAILCITHEEAVVRYLADREIQLASLSDEFAGTAGENKGDEIKGARILEVRNLIYTHQYGGMLYRQGATVGPLDFKLHKGSCIGIIGESGSGKSTLAQLLVGLYHPASGELSVEGRRVVFKREEDVYFLRSKVQLVMQDGRGSLHPNFSVDRLLKEVVHERKKHKPSYALNVPDVLREVSLPESILDRIPSALSGGECLRVSIARALLMEPEVLICDESTTSLDGQTRDSIIELLRNLVQTKGLSLVLISHDEHIIRGIANEILVMSSGKVVEQGPADQLIRYPTHHMTRKIFSTRATMSAKRESL